MKLCNKLFAVLVVFSIFISGIQVSAASRDIPREAYRLEGLGFLDAADLNVNQAQMSRALFVKTAVRLYLSGNAAPHYAEVDFKDVNPSGFASNEIQFALKAGLIEKADYFYPDNAISYDEAIKVIVKVLGYGPAAEAEGYVGAALKAKVLQGVNAKFELKDALKLLDNALESPLMKPVSYGDDIMSAVDEDSTLLSGLGIDIIKADITNVDVSNSKIEANGNIYFTENIDLGTIPEGRAEIYVRKNDDIVIYIDVLGDTKIVYDFIEYVNDEQSKSSIYPSAIREISLRNSGETFEVEDGAKITLNEQSAAGNYINTFAKIIIKKDKIAKVEAYSLRVGGLIYRADKNRIKYATGEMAENVISGFEQVKELEIYVDGVRSSNMLDLKADMVFDYWHNEDGTKFIIIASTRTAEGRFESYDANAIWIDGVEYEMNETNKLIAQSYITKKYANQEEYTQLLSKTVKIYIDDNMCARFIKAEEALSEMNEFYGVVLGVGSESALGGQYEVKVHKITGGAGEAIYKVSSKLSADSLSMVDVASVAKNYEGRGFLKFTLNNQNEIKKIEIPEYWGFTQNISRIERNANIVGMSFRKATVFALLEIDGEFTVKHLTANNISDTQVRDGVSMTMVSDFDLRNNPVPRFIALTKNCEKLFNYYTTITMLEKTSYLPDDKVKLNFTGGLSYVVTKEFAVTNGLTERSLVRFLDKGFGENPLYIVSRYNLIGEPQDWKTDAYSPDKNSGFFKMDSVRYRDENVIQFETAGEPSEVYLVNEGCSVFEFDPWTGKCERRSLEDISKGYPVWYYVVDWTKPKCIQNIYYVNTGMTPPVDN